MSLTVENLDGNMAKLTITASAQDFEKAVKSAYNKEKGKITAPGFRKGKVPQAYLEKIYGSEVFYEEAANICMQEAYPNALDECDLEIVSRPEIEVVQMEKGKDFIFSATVAVKPEVELGKYKGIQIDKPDMEVTDADIEAELLNVQKQNARNVPITDRPAKLDDEVTIDFEGFMDGVAFEGGKGENHQLLLGSHSFIDNFEEQLVGKNINDELTVNVTFPEEYQAEELAGKPATFQVLIKGIKETELPELDDEFASEVSEFDTLDEYKEDIKATLQEKKEKEAKSAKEVAVIDKIAENAKMDIPEPMIEHTKEQIYNEFAQGLNAQGLSAEQYFQLTGTNPEAFMEQMTPEAEKRIRSRLVLEAIVKAEDIQVDDEEVQAKLEEMASMYQMDIEKLNTLVGEEEKKAMKMDIAVEQALHLAVEAAVEK